MERQISDGAALEEIARMFLHYSHNEEVYDGDLAVEIEYVVEQTGRRTTRTNPWIDDPEYPSSDWKAEVVAGDTRLGYADWVKHQRES